MNSFNHQHTAHCESGVMSTLLKHQGVNIDEPMAFGLASALAFAYIPFVKVSGMPLIAYRMPPRSIINGLQKQLKLDICYKKFSNPDRGMAALDEALSKNKVVGLQASVFWLPYFPPEMRFHFNAHNLIVYGKQGDDYLISDPVFEDVVLCSANDLKAARFAKGALAAKGFMYYINDVPSEIDYSTIIAASIKKNRKIMHAPVPIIGLRGIEYLAKKIEKQAKVNNRSKNRYLNLFLGHVVRMQEEIGTGGAGFRYMYASFLQQSAKILNRSDYAQASQLMTEVGDDWRNFAALAVKVCRQGKNESNDLQEQLYKVTSLLRLCAEKERQVWALLR